MLQGMLVTREVFYGVATDVLFFCFFAPSSFWLVSGALSSFAYLLFPLVFFLIPVLVLQRNHTGLAPLTAHTLFSMLKILMNLHVCKIPLWEEIL